MEFLFAAPFVLAGSFIAKRRRKAKKQAANMANRRQAAARHALSRSDLRSWYKEALDEIIESRLNLESNNSSGNIVLVSHYIERGRLQHWVLYTHGHKYELRQTAESKKANNRGSGSGGNKKLYEPKITKSEYDEATRKRSVQEKYSPEVGRFFYSVVGWTTLSKAQIDKACGETFDTFKSHGEYNLVFNNCQDFLRTLADRIVTRRAQDWAWFRKYGVRRYKYIDQPEVSDDVIFAEMWLRQLETERRQLKGSELAEITQLMAELKSFIESNLPGPNGPDFDGDGDGGHDGGHDGGNDGGGGDGGC